MVVNVKSYSQVYQSVASKNKLTMLWNIYSNSTFSRMRTLIFFTPYFMYKQNERMHNFPDDNGNEESSRMYHEKYNKNPKMGPKLMGWSIEVLYIQRNEKGTTKTIQKLGSRFDITTCWWLIYSGLYYNNNSNTYSIDGKGRTTVIIKSMGGLLCLRIYNQASINHQTTSFLSRSLWVTDVLNS